MKTILPAMLWILCGAATSVSYAQPTIYTNEYYHIGDVVQMVNCNPDTMTAGNAGANITWDFSALTSTGTSVTTVENDTSSVFITANVLLRLSTGQKWHLRENNTDSYLLGIEDSSTGVTANYYSYDISQRPIAYMTVYVDSYQVVTPATSLVGKGYLTTTVDGYGTLKLPTGTYSNVLRVREYQTETDTTGGSTISSSTRISYLWFDLDHTPPLLRMDSTISLFGNSNTIMYLSATTGVEHIGKQAAKYQCGIRDDEMLLSGNFISGKAYDIDVYTVAGSRIYSTVYTAMGGTARFMIGSISPGIYLVSIVPKTDPDNREVIKTVKE